MKKQELRKIYLEKRLLISAIEYEKLNQALLQQFTTLDFSETNAVHVFLPMLRTKEPDTQLLINYLKEHHPNIKRVFPKANFKQKTLINFLDGKDLIIAKNKYGISEPISGNQFYIDKNSIVIVPLLAFDLQGNRVGYGGGFYDRFLAECEPGTQFIGLSFFDPVDVIDDANETDVRLHQCITPQKIWKF
jgi:5-formyltetrahydrofolate cyclo-ligase